MRTFLTVSLVSLGLNALAQTNATQLLDGAQATYDQALPLGLAIMGTFMCVAIGRKVWTRFAK